MVAVVWEMGSTARLSRSGGNKEVFYNSFGLAPIDPNAVFVSQESKGNCFEDPAAAMRNLDATSTVIHKGNEKMTDGDTCDTRIAYCQLSKCKHHMIQYSSRMLDATRGIPFADFNEDKRKALRKMCKKCARCMSVSYCSSECQKGDWADHKRVCKALCAQKASD